MQRPARSWRVAAIVSIVGCAGVSAAQFPVCPHPDPDQPVYTACLAGGRSFIVPLLTNLATDHLLKADGVSITRDAHALFASTASADTLEKNAALADYLKRFAPLELTRIDTATGTVRLDVGEDQRSFSAAVAVGEAEYRMGLELPARIEGGYWRTPGVLQMAFWKGQRPSFTTRSAAGAEIAAEIDCIVLSADGIRLVTNGPSVPDILVGFDRCE